MAHWLAYNDALGIQFLGVHQAALLGLDAIQSEVDHQFDGGQHPLHGRRHLLLVLTCKVLFLG